MLAYIHQFIRPLGASADEVMFENYGYEWSQNGLFEAILTFDPSTSYVFSTLIAVVYSIFERNPFLIQLIGAFLGSFLLLYVYKMILIFTNSKRFSLTLTFFISILPSLNIISILFLRDIYIIFFLIIFFYSYSKWLLSKKLNFFLYSLFFIILAGFFHGILFLLIPLIIIIEMIVLMSKLSFIIKFLVIKKYEFLILILTPIIFVSIIVALFLGLGSSKLAQGQAIFEQDPRAIQKFAGEIIKTEADVVIYPSPEAFDFISLILHIPERVAFFLTTPYPWMYSKITDIPRIWDSLIMIILIIYLIINFKSFIQRKEFFILFICILFLFTVFAFGSVETSSGTRHRLKVLVPFIILLMSFIYSKERELSNARS
ncbi:hypothetical protein N5T57_10410 [Aliarcobacter cryaerophilus]|uniref:hypothetical protein n=1 Tax=Aliarcobacter cryaerophilus TaxID=28198 RepID=UPI0021B2DB69|nr:hypothetical protein [Aliarcobacter cryaerophilus]MCT7523338.1 hypothetical protein [Aliarcobacter cryaerophilus]